LPLLVAGINNTLQMNSNAEGMYSVVHTSATQISRPEEVSHLQPLSHMQHDIQGNRVPIVFEEPKKAQLDAVETQSWHRLVSRGWISSLCLALGKGGREERILLLL